MPTSDLTRAFAALPPACRGPVERVLSESPAERVALVQGPAGPLVVRLVRDARGLSGELAVLARLRSPRLARLVDGGTLAGGGAFLAREWVAGADLAAGAARGPADAAALVLEVALGLVELHRSGFAHGDLKPANLILREGGGVCLTDFGFARGRRGGHLSSASGGRGGGTLGFVAPEVLVGGAATPASDLFSLGVTWLMLLGAPLPPPSSLYGRFPAESFVTAAGLGPSALLEAHRDLIAELLHRDPRARPSSAADFARRLAARLDVALGSHGAGALLRAAPEAPYWPRAAGREAVYRGALDRCAAQRHVEVWRLPSAAEARAVAREVTLTEAVRGRAIQLVDLEAELEACADSGAFDRWLAALERRSAAATLVLAGSAEPWTRELSRALAGIQPTRGLVRCVGPEVAAAEGDRALPPQGAAVMAVLLQRALPGEAAERIELLAGVLAAETRGAAEDAAARVDALFRAGHVCDEGDGARTVEGVDAAALLRASPRVEARVLRALPEPQRRLLGALCALEALDGTAVEDALAAAGEGCTERELDELVRRGWVELQVERGKRRTFTRVALSMVELGLERAVRRAVYGRAAAAVAAQRGARDERTWPLRYLSEGARVVPELVAEARAAITRGAAPRVRAALQRLRERAAQEAEPMPGELAAELALAWIHTDDVRSAAAELQPLLVQAGVSQRAAWLSALVARATRDTARELELFRRAGDERNVARAEVHAALAAGDVARVEALVAEYAADLGASAAVASLDDEALAAHVDILGAAALSALRRGDQARVEHWVTAALAIAERTEFAALRAAVASNVATVRRRLGDLAAALPMYERAVAESKVLGRASALARARLALAGVLRDLGRVAEAEPLALEALGTRRRAGDAAGTALARGVYGLVLADRGHLHAGSVELARAAEELARTGQPEQAALMTARLTELRARSGAGAPDLAQVRAYAAREPRIDIALARAAACAGDVAAAGDAAQRARAAAVGLGFKQVAREAELVLRALGRPTGAEGAAEPQPLGSLVADDERVLELLTADQFAAAPAFELARELAARGRDDRAARLAIAVAARDRDPVRSERAAALARSALERALAGVERAVAAAAEQRLLGLPDPCPTDLDRWRSQPEDEMDVLTVLGINERLVEQQDRDTLLRAIVDAALEVTGAERGFIVLEEHGELSLDRALDSARGDLAADEVEFSSSIVLAALEQGGPLRVADAGEDVQYSAARSVASFELRSVLCQPFTVEDGLRGVVLVDERRRPGAFGPREERLLGLLAGQAALALRQVRRLESITRLRDELALRVVERETRLEVAERRLEARGQVPPVEGLIGDSAPMQAVHKLLRRIAPSELPVLVTGESGTGKEVAARALHALSPRVKGPFIAENCAALPATLLESELFGSRRGSYTGAERDREGLFERAHGGTLFLDEIGELPLDQQAKLLRVLETREVRRIGDTETRAVDFRLVVATHRDLAQEVREGRFREDLMYRLDTVRIVMPPLRERLQDVPQLVAHFVRLAGARDGRVRRVAPEVMKALAARPWPGNVRELANEVARLLVLAEGDLTDPGLLRTPVGVSGGGGFDLVRPLAELEREAILAALARTGGDKREAAELLGISRAKVYQRLKEWGLGAAE